MPPQGTQLFLPCGLGIDKPVVFITIDEYEGKKEIVEILSSHPGITIQL